eukprot:244645_1
MQDIIHTQEIPSIIVHNCVAKSIATIASLCAICVLYALLLMRIRFAKNRRPFFAVSLIRTQELFELLNSLFNYNRIQCSFTPNAIGFSARAFHSARHLCYPHEKSIIFDPTPMASSSSPTPDKIVTFLIETNTIQ